MGAIVEHLLQKRLPFVRKSFPIRSKFFSHLCAYRSPIGPFVVGKTPPPERLPLCSRVGWTLYAQSEHVVRLPSLCSNPWVHPQSVLLTMAHQVWRTCVPNHHPIFDHLIDLIVHSFFRRRVVLTLSPRSSSRHVILILVVFLILVSWLTIAHQVLRACVQTHPRDRVFLCAIILTCPLAFLSCCFRTTTLSVSPTPSPSSSTTTPGGPRSTRCVPHEWQHTRTDTLSFFIKRFHVHVCVEKMRLIGATLGTANILNLPLRLS